MTARLARLGGTLQAKVGWRRIAAAFGFGALSAVALPPAHLWPFAVAGFAALHWLLDGAARPRGGFGIAWAFSFGYFAASLYWIAFALLVDAPKFAWMIPFATLGLSAGLAAFAGLAGWAFVRVGARGVAGALLLAVLWTVGEWLRGHVLTGFPWNLVGTVWGGVPSMMQVAALFGTYGLSLLTVALGALLAAAIRPAARASGRIGANWSGPILAALVLAAAWGGGAWRLSDVPRANVPDIALRLVQPDVPQSLKWDPAARERNFRALLELTKVPGFADRTHLVWPESAVPFALDNDARLRLAIAAVTPAGGLTITGALRVANDVAGGVRVWNSVHAVDGSGTLIASYDKFHLVPFGEYVPLRRYLTPLGVEKITAGAIDFSAGPGPVTLDLPGLPPASPLICYEVIFPGEVVAATRRPGWLVNVTNDAWFGITAGPHQHFASARFRAVEEGLPVVRAANNGISGVIDPYGRVTAQLALGRRGVLDAALPAALAPTPYARYGDMLLAALTVIVLAIAWALRRVV